MSIVIKAENISKQYLISHAQSAHYSTLSDSAAGFASKFKSRFKLRGQADGVEAYMALDDINFEIRQGDSVGIVGHNGAGKSTLLKIISRITAPSSGWLGLNGRVASLLEVGTGFHPELTGRENIFLNGSILGMSRADILTRFDEIVEFSEVERFLDTPVKRYSSGMRVRLAFSVAANLESDILIVDEVLAVGDAKFQQKCLGKMDSVTKQDKTIVFVSHNMTALKKLCGKSLYLQEGRLVDFAATDVVVRDYQLSLAQRGVPDGQELVCASSPGLVLKSIEVLDEKGAGSTVIESGAGMSFGMMFDSEAVYKGVQVSIGIDSLDGDRVGYLQTEMAGAEMSLPIGTGEIQCSIPRVSLVPGDYYISVKVSKAFETLFWLPKYMKFSVVDGDFFGTGKTIQERWVGKHYIEHSWK